MRLAGKTAIAIKFSKEGTDVGILHTFDDAEAEQSGALVAATGRRAVLLRLDVRDRDGVELAASTAKVGMVALAQGMALELTRQRIGVAVICLSVIEAAGNIALLCDPARRQEIERHIRWGRADQPRDVANLAAFLASDGAEYLNGTWLSWMAGCSG